MSTPQYAADDLTNLIGGLQVGVKAMVPMLLHDVLRNTAADVIVLVGETGGGKTLSILAAACEYGIMFYYKCNYLRLNFRDRNVFDNLQCFT